MQREETWMLEQEVDSHQQSSELACQAWPPATVPGFWFPQSSRIVSRSLPLLCNRALHQYVGHFMLDTEIYDWCGWQKNPPHVFRRAATWGPLDSDSTQRFGVHCQEWCDWQSVQRQRHVKATCLARYIQCPQANQFSSRDYTNVQSFFCNDPS